jgi:hypothetical protein
VKLTVCGVPLKVARAAQVSTLRVVKLRPLHGVDQWLHVTCRRESTPSASRSRPFEPRAEGGELRFDEGVAPRPFGRQGRGAGLARGQRGG